MAYSVRIDAARGEDVISYFDITDEDNVQFDMSDWTLTYTVFSLDSLGTEFTLTSDDGIEIDEDGYIVISITDTQSDIEPAEYGHDLRYVDGAGLKFQLFSGVLAIHQGRDP